MTISFDEDVFSTSQMFGKREPIRSLVRTTFAIATVALWYDALFRWKSTLLSGNLGCSSVNSSFKRIAGTRYCIHSSKKTPPTFCGVYRALALLISTCSSSSLAHFHSTAFRSMIRTWVVSMTSFVVTPIGHPQRPHFRSMYYVYNYAWAQISIWNQRDKR